MRLPLGVVKCYSLVVIPVSEKGMMFRYLQLALWILVMASTVALVDVAYGDENISGDNDNSMQTSEEESIEDSCVAFDYEGKCFIYADIYVPEPPDIGYDIDAMEWRCASSLISISCYEAAYSYMRGSFGAEEDHEKVAWYYEFACDLFRASGCYQLAKLYEEGDWDLGQDYEKAAIFYERGCNNPARSQGCSKVAQAYEHGLGVEPDLEKAELFYLKSCANKNYTSCHYLGSVYENGNWFGRDLTKSLE